jgi:hypothetical protein
MDLESKDMAYRFSVRDRTAGMWNAVPVVHGMPHSISRRTQTQGFIAI